MAISSVFLSYARSDQAVVQPLADAVRAAGIAVWRDEEKLYGGQKWPVALGEAVAQHPCLLLMWSKNAAASAYVELEWCTALAMKNTIIPCLLDHTPVPPALSAVQWVDAAQSGNNAVDEILKALGQAPAAEHRSTASAVIDSLAAIPASTPKKVLQAARNHFEQSEWRVQGNVYQAAGDIHVTAVSGPPKKKSLLATWQARVALLIGVLTVVALVFELPDKILSSKLIKAGAPDAPVRIEQTLSGTIRDSANDPVPGVSVSLPEFGVTAMTDALGYFRIHVTAPKQQTVELMAQKHGFRTHEAYATLGNSALSFTLKDKP